MERAARSILSIDIAGANALGRLAQLGQSPINRRH